MKKKPALLVLFIAAMLLFPSSYLANIEEKEYNEYGIEKGTEVYGEDISTLTEEELQYIPEGWRDGIIEEHQHGEDLPQNNGIMAVYPDVNNYIVSENLKTASIEYDHKPVFTKFNYRYGFGNIEGVVAHETANNSSTITGEINYMLQNHKNAFVHAFVDHNRIIEIHPPELGAWGGGRYANGRFVHVELVRVHSFEEFAKSINNYTDYIASLLYKYNLEIVDADRYSEGTLWSHRAVSNFLGGTNHTDPHGYFERWGYTWNDFVSLVTRKYNAKVAEKEQYTSKIGHIKSSNVQILKDPLNPTQFVLAGNQYTNEVYYSKQEFNLNGAVYYLLSREESNKSSTIGWIKETDLSIYEHNIVNEMNDAEELIIIGNGNAYNKPWGGSKNLVTKDLTINNGAAFEVEQLNLVGSSTWYEGMLNGSKVWVDANSVAKETRTSKLGHLRSENVKIYPKLGDETTALTAGSTYTHAVYYIKKEALVNGQTYYLLSRNPSSTSGLIGWAKAEDLSTDPHLVVDKEQKTFHLKGTGSSYSKAWGGKKDFVYSDLSSVRNQLFNVHLTESVGSNTWYRGELNGRTVWIHSNHVLNFKESSTSMLGHIRSENVKIYPELGNETTAIPAKTDYTHAVYYIKKEAEVGGQLYYLLSHNPSSTTGVVGWTKAEDLTAQPHTVIDKKEKIYYLKGTGSAYTKAWGGKRDYVYSDLSSMRDQQFNVHLTESVGGNTWYRGELNGKTVWIHSNYVVGWKETSTSRLGHLRSENVQIYSEPGNEAHAVKAGSEYTHAVYYIKKEAVVNHQKYYLLSKNPSSISGVVGWAKAEDLSTQSHLVIDKKEKNFYLKGTGSAYTKAWGGRKDYVYSDLSLMKNHVFKVHLTESVGNNVWYRGDLNGRTVWIHSTFLK